MEKKFTAMQNWLVLEIITMLLWSSAQPTAPLPRLGLRGDLTALCFPPHNPVIASVTHIHTHTHTHETRQLCLHSVGLWELSADLSTDI